MSIKNNVLTMVYAVLACVALIICATLAAGIIYVVGTVLGESWTLILLFCAMVYMMYREMKGGSNERIA
jgi:hypothetical protein